MMTGETGEEERDRWIANLEDIAALNPTFVVAGHKKAENDNDPKIISESPAVSERFFPHRFRRADTAGIVQRMTGLYPDRENVRTLWYSARAAIARKA